MDSKLDLTSIPDDGLYTKKMSIERQKEILKEMQKLKKMHTAVQAKIDSLGEKGEVKYYGLLNLAIVFLYATMMLSGKLPPNAMRNIVIIMNSLSSVLTLYNIPLNASISVKEMSLKNKLDSIDEKIDINNDIQDTIKLLKLAKFKDEESRHFFIENQTRDQKDFNSLVSDLEEHSLVTSSNEEIAVNLDAMMKNIINDIDISEHDVDLMTGLLSEGIIEMSNFDSRRSAKQAMRIEIDDIDRRELELELPNSVKELLNGAILDKSLEMTIEEIVKKYSEEVLDLNSLPKRTAVEIRKSIESRNKS